jgi:hypothetical protein
MKNLVVLRKWRDALTQDKPVLTRECQRGVISQMGRKKYKILTGKGHEIAVLKDDLFPLEWIDILREWRHKKDDRDNDVPLPENETL